MSGLDDSGSESGGEGSPAVQQQPLIRFDDEEVASGEPVSYKALSYRQRWEARNTARKRTIYLNDLKTKADAESNLSSNLRFFTWTSNFFDTAATVGSAGIGMVARLTTATDPNGALTADAGNTARNLGMLGPWGFFFSNFFYLLRIGFTGQGKQNRWGKIAYAALGICGPILAGQAISISVGIVGFSAVMGSAGFSAALLASPLFGVLINLAIIARNSIRLFRTYQGLKPENLLAQKQEKLQLAVEADEKERIARFQLEAISLELYIEELRKTLGKKAGEQITREEMEADAEFKRLKGAQTTFSEKNLHNAIKAKLGSEGVCDKEALKHLLNGELKELARQHAVSLIRSQQNKWDWSGRFNRRQYFIPSTILCTIFITLCILGFLSLLATPAMPFAIPALFAIAPALQLASFGLGFGVLGCMGAFAGLSVTKTIKQYKDWRNEYAAIEEKYQAHLKQYEQLTSPDSKTQAEHRQWVDYHQAQQERKVQERDAMGLRVSGMTLLLLAALLTMVAFLPFVNIAVLGFVGVALAAVSIGLVVAGAVRAYQAREAAKKPEAAEPESSPGDDETLAHEHDSGPQVTVAPQLGAFARRTSGASSVASQPVELADIAAMASYGDTPATVRRRTPPAGSMTLGGDAAVKAAELVQRTHRRTVSSS